MTLTTMTERPMMNTRYYRGILHNHSNCSQEGCYPLTILRQRWAEELDFAAMTEHAERTTPEDFASYVQECDRLSDEQFRFIPGLEVSTTSGDILLLGCRKYIRTTDPLQVLDEAPDCLILLAHPEDGHMIQDVLERVHGVEVWNLRHMGGFVPPLDWLERWKQRFPEGKMLTGGNDIHRIDPKRKIRTLVQSNENTEAALLAALKEKRFTTSNGVFALSPCGYSTILGSKITSPFLQSLLPCSYRFIWRSELLVLHLAGKLLRQLKISEQVRLRLSRLIRQHV